jgi:site-specific DNA-methyltransferase (adenine-specific)
VTNKLYYGDNLQVLRDYIADESVDLIYLDPPFNSNASYSILFKTPQGHGADAQIGAFEDTWTWGPASDAALMDITQSTGVAGRVAVSGSANIAPKLGTC